MRSECHWNEERQLLYWNEECDVTSWATVAESTRHYKETNMSLCYNKEINMKITYINYTHTHTQHTTHKADIQATYVRTYLRALGASRLRG